MEEVFKILLSSLIFLFLLNKIMLFYFNTVFFITVVLTFFHIVDTAHTMVRATKIHHFMCSGIFGNRRIYTEFKE